jgi:hypothetical protein
MDFEDTQLAKSYRGEPILPAKSYREKLKLPAKSYFLSVI